MKNKLEKWADILDKKIVAFRGVRLPKAKQVWIEYILFDDGETFIELREQDSYTFRDCDMYAKTMLIRNDKELWLKMFEKQGGFDESNITGSPL